MNIYLALSLVIKKLLQKFFVNVLEDTDRSLQLLKVWQEIFDFVWHCKFLAPILALVLSNNSGADPEILKRGSALCRPPWLDDEENFRFQMV